MSKIIRTRKPSVLPYYAAALAFVVLCAVLPVYRLWALLAALGAAVLAFAGAKKICPPRVVETEVPFHTGVDDVDAMLYLDFGREAGQWRPNLYGSNENLQAVEFLKHLNSIVKKRNPGVLLIAQEDGLWPQLTDSVENDHLGFDYKWSGGWTKDLLSYIEVEPLERKDYYDQLTLSMMYAYSEHFVLVLSHDEVVHLKCSMLGKMPGDRESKFANLKLAYAYMCGHPGKKLLFMGQEFAQWNEWSEERALDWYLLDDPSHKEMQQFTKKCMKLYSSYPCLYATDYKPEGFAWINANDVDNSVYSFIRISPDGKKNLLFVLNFTPVARKQFRVGVPADCKYRLGSHEKIQAKQLTVDKGDCDGYSHSVLVDLPEYGIAVYEFTAKQLENKTRI